MAKQSQFDLIEPERIWKETLLAKIQGLVDYGLYERLSKCGVEEHYATCVECGAWDVFYYQCCNKFCPLCNWRIARKRADLLKAWTTTIKQPKHIVLTMQNFAVLTKREVRIFRLAFSKLRRRKLWEQVKGGCISMEVTNEGRGWHLHAHILADVRWIDAGQLAKEWARLVGQQFGIVKVKDCRGMEYLGEITKYVAKPAQLCSWHPEEIAQFIGTVTKSRWFATFGTLFKLRKQVAALLEPTERHTKTCKCGCEDFRYTDEVSEVCRDAERNARSRRR